MVKKLIQLERENPGYYKTRPVGYMEQRIWMWHPLMAATAHSLFAPSTVNTEEVRQNVNEGAAATALHNAEAAADGSALDITMQDGNEHSNRNVIDVEDASPTAGGLTIAEIDANQLITISGLESAERDPYARALTVFNQAMREARTTDSYDDEEAGYITDSEADRQMLAAIDASLAEQGHVQRLPPVVIDEGGYEARQRSRRVQIEPDDPGKGLVEPDIVFESSDSDEDMRSRYECIGRNRARIMEEQLKRGRGKAATHVSLISMAVPPVPDEAAQVGPPGYMNDEAVMIPQIQATDAKESNIQHMHDLEGMPRTPVQAIVDSGVPDSVPYVLQDERDNDRSFHGALITRFLQASTDIEAEALAMNVARHMQVDTGERADLDDRDDVMALSPVSDAQGSYDEMLDRHHDSLVVETAIPTTAERMDGMFASSVQNLYDANEMEVPFIDLVTSVPMTQTENPSSAAGLQVPFIDLTTSSEDMGTDAPDPMSDVAENSRNVKQEQMTECLKFQTVIDGEPILNSTPGNAATVDQCLKYQTVVQGIPCVGSTPRAGFVSISEAAVNRAGSVEAVQGNADYANGALTLNNSAAAGVRRRQKRSAHRGSRRCRQRIRRTPRSMGTSAAVSSDEDGDDDNNHIEVANVEPPNNTTDASTYGNTS